MNTEDITITPLQTMAQYQTCERLQHIIWRSDPVEVVPAHLLITAQRHGGLVLGAFDPTGEMIGCLFGFAGRVAPDNPAAAGGPLWQHCSHFMGVVPEWRGRGVGYRLKCAQREWALSQGFQLVTWTYDPLEAANGVLNLGKLGAVCRCYLRNVYGEIADGLNAGLPSDRFEVAWWVGSARVRERIEQGWQRPRMDDLLQEGAIILNAASPRFGGSEGGGWLEPGETREPEGEQLLVEIPSRMQAIKAADMDLALAWRLNVRAACEAAFTAGYTACDVVRAEVDGVPRVYYLLAGGTLGGSGAVRADNRSGRGELKRGYHDPACTGWHRLIHQPFHLLHHGATEIPLAALLTYTRRYVFKNDQPSPEHTDYRDPFLDHRSSTK